MDIITLALAKKFATKISAGYSKVEVDGMDIIFTLNDGSQVTLTVPAPADGVSVTDLDINENNELICTMSDGTTINAGEVPVADLSEYAKIEYVDEENEKLKEELDNMKMVYNAMPKVSDEGMDITINNTAECPVYDIELKGNIHQKTTTGKNLFGVEIESGTYNGTGFPIDNANRLRTKNSIYLSSGTYTISCKEEFTTVIYQSDTGAADSYSVGTYSSIPYTFTLSSNKYVLFAFNKNDTALTPSSLTEIQLEQGSTATTYEPYTGGQPSPSPEFPQNIHVVSGDNEIKVENKNLINIEQSEQGSISNATGELISNNTSWRASDYINVIPSGTYTFSSNISIDKTIYQYDKNKNYIGNFPAISTTSGTVTLDEQARYIKWKYYRANGTNESFTKSLNLQIEHNNQATTYIEHKEQTYPISLDNLEYCKIENYEDEFVLTTGKNSFKPTLQVDEINIFTQRCTATLNNDEFSLTVTGNGNMYFGYIQAETQAYQSQNGYLVEIPKNATKAYLLVTNADLDKNIIGFYDSNKISLGSIESTSATIPIGAKYLNVRFGKNNATSGSVYKTKVMVSFETIKEYEPYGTGQWYLKKNINKVIYDGTQTISYALVSDTNTTRVRYLLSQNSIASSYNNYCNLLVGKSIWSVDEEGIYTNDNNLVFRINKSTIGTTSEQVLSYLSSHNLICYYPLAIPTYTLLSDTLQTQLDNLSNAISYSQQTNVSQTNNDLPFIIKLSAIKDISSL